MAIFSCTHVNKIYILRNYILKIHRLIVNMIAQQFDLNDFFKSKQNDKVLRNR